MATAFSMAQLSSFLVHPAERVMEQIGRVLGVEMTVESEHVDVQPEQRVARDLGSSVAAIRSSHALMGGRRQQVRSEREPNDVQPSKGTSGPAVIAPMVLVDRPEPAPIAHLGPESRSKEASRPDDSSSISTSSPRRPKIRVVPPTPRAGAAEPAPPLRVEPSNPFTSPVLDTAPPSAPAPASVARSTSAYVAAERVTHGLSPIAADASRSSHEASIVPLPARKQLVFVAPNDTSRKFNAAPLSASASASEPRSTSAYVSAERVTHGLSAVSADARRSSHEASIVPPPARNQLVFVAPNDTSPQFDAAPLSAPASASEPRSTYVAAERVTHGLSPVAAEAPRRSHEASIVPPPARKRLVFVAPNDASPQFDAAPPSALERVTRGVSPVSADAPRSSHEAAIVPPPARKGHVFVAPNGTPPSPGTHSSIVEHPLQSSFPASDEARPSNDAPLPRPRPMIRAVPASPRSSVLEPATPPRDVPVNTPLPPARKQLRFAPPVDATMIAGNVPHALVQASAHSVPLAPATAARATLGLAVTSSDTQRIPADALSANPSAEATVTPSPNATASPSPDADQAGARPAPAAHIHRDKLEELLVDILRDAARRHGLEV